MRLSEYIGVKVKKKSGKPFKSGLKTATIKDYIEHPRLPNKFAFTFVEDDSCVRTDA